MENIGGVRREGIIRRLLGGAETRNIVYEISRTAFQSRLVSMH